MSEVDELREEVKSLKIEVEQLKQRVLLIGADPQVKNSVLNYLQEHPDAWTTEIAENIDAPLVQVLRSLDELSREGTIE